MASKNPKDDLYKGDPERLNEIAHETDKKSTNDFVNPGTPEAALVTEADRKTGIISGGASQKLKDHIGPKG